MENFFVILAPQGTLFNFFQIQLQLQTCLYTEQLLNYSMQCRMTVEHFGGIANSF